MTHCVNAPFDCSPLSSAYNKCDLPYCLISTNAVTENNLAQNAVSLKELGKKRRGATLWRKTRPSGKSKNSNNIIFTIRARWSSRKRFDWIDPKSATPSRLVPTSNNAVLTQKMIDMLAAVDRHIACGVISHVPAAASLLSGAMRSNRFYIIHTSRARCSS